MHSGQGAAEVTDAAGGHILYCQITDAIGGDLPVYADDEWEIIRLEGEQVLVNGICSETTGWVYTSYVPMKYVMQNAAWINRLLITGVVLLMLLGSPYVPIQRLIGILFESGYQKIRNENDMDYLAQSLYQVEAVQSKFIQFFSGKEA